MVSVTPATFLRRLSHVKLSDRACNQYAPRLGGAGTATRIRRDNLERYLNEMRVREPRVLLIGEAPSHRGARLTGIPFMSETLLLVGLESPGIFGAVRGYQKTDETERPSTEASATMVWSTIKDLRPLPLLWNAFPFHPFQPGNAASNRMPTSAELGIGEQFIEMMMSMFAIETIVAIGRRAEASLCRLGLDHQSVRHPSRGGKQLFVRGVREVSENLSK